MGFRTNILQVLEGDSGKGQEHSGDPLGLYLSADKAVMLCGSSQATFDLDTDQWFSPYMFKNSFTEE